MRHTFILFLLLVLPTLRLWAQALAVQRTQLIEAPGITAPETAGVAPAPIVYYAADEMPTFAGGTKALLQFLQAKQHYPAEAQERNISGTVHVRFVVDEQGRLRDPTVVRGLGAGLDEEALRLVRIMPWWNPGRLNGRPVRVAYALPISFRLLQ